MDHTSGDWWWHELKVIGKQKNYQSNKSQKVYLNRRLVSLSVSGSSDIHV